MCEPVLKQISAEVKKQNLCGPNNKNRGTLNFRPDYHNCASYEGMLWELDKEIIQKIDKNFPERMIDLIIRLYFYYSY